jgi:hypothetical protein
VKVGKPSLETGMLRQMSWRLLNCHKFTHKTHRLSLVRPSFTPTHHHIYVVGGWVSTLVLKSPPLPLASNQGSVLNSNNLSEPTPLGWAVQGFEGSDDTEGKFVLRVPRDRTISNWICATYYQNGFIVNLLLAVKVDWIHAEKMNCVFTPSPGFRERATWCAPHEVGWLLWFARRKSVETCSFVPLGRVDPCRLNLHIF